MRFYQWRFTKADLRQELEMRGFVVEKFIPIHKDEGWRRALVWDVHLRQGTRIFAVAERFLCRLLPGSLISHMIMAVASKPKAGVGRRPESPAKVASQTQAAHGGLECTFRQNKFL